MVRFESKSLVCSCSIFIPLYVYESKYFNFTSFMKIFPFFPDDPADTGIFCKCVRYLTPFTQLLQTRVCFTNAGINTYGVEIHKVRKHAIHALPSFLFLILLFRLYLQEPFSEIMERQNNRLV